MNNIVSGLLGQNNHNDLESIANSWRTRMASGSLAYQVGAYIDACRHFRLALDMAKQSGLGTPCEARSMVCLAKVLSAQGNYGEAESLIKKALQIDNQEQALLDATEDCHQLSLLYWREGKTELALQTAEEAKDLAELAADIPDELHAKLLKHFAVLYLELGQHTKCGHFVEKAKDFILSSNSLGRQSSIYGDVLLVNVLLLLEQKKTEEAMELYPYALQIITMNRGLNNPRVHEVQALFDELTRDNLFCNPSQLHERLLEAMNKTRHGII